MIARHAGGSHELASPFEINELDSESRHVSYTADGRARREVDVI